MSVDLLPDATDVALAADRIRDWVRETPIMRITGPGARPVVLKLETLQRSGSFKLRGALNKLMALGADARGGVVTASGGNHGLGVAWAGWLLGVPVSVCVPADTPAFKYEAIERANAEIMFIPGGYPEAALHAQALARSQSLPYVHAYDDADVIAGQGTLMREFLEQAPDISTVVVAIGGGGLAAGTVLAADGRRVVGVEPEGAPTMARAFENDAPITLSEIDTVAADALGAGTAGQLTFSICKAGLDRVELVKDAHLLDAQKWLWQHLRIVSELGGSTGLAAFAQGRCDGDPGPIGVVICGGNVDPSKLSHVG